MTTVDHFDSSPNIGRDAYRLSVHESTAGKGSIVVGLLWLALIVIAVAPSLIPQPAALASPAELSVADTSRPWNFGRLDWLDRWEILRKYYLALPFRMLRNLSRQVRKPVRD
jgi:hypothetical protein